MDVKQDWRGWSCGRACISCLVHRRGQSVSCFQHEVFGTGEYAWLQPAAALASGPERPSRRGRQYDGRVVELDGAARTGRPNHDWHGQLFWRMAFCIGLNAGVCHGCRKSEMCCPPRQ
jgi:hypothetical protein